ncbi:MAG: HEAT repeat domain-containing protein [Planctomycetia bacterium]|nr:HEAT repeat domain-containing protein [Planctomycetia bacterium]
MDTISQICEQLGSPEQAKAYRARRELAVRVAAAGAPGKESDRAVLAAEIAEQYGAMNETKDDRGRPQKNPRHVPAVRNELARALADIGGEAEVPALVGGVADFNVREMARFALDRNPSAASTAALTEAAQKSVGVEFRTGTAGALSKRSGPGVVEALKGCATDTSPDVRLAAAEALSSQADASGDAVIVAAAKELGAASPRAAKRMSIARLQLAQTLAKAGQKDAARGIYQAMAADGADKAQKKAAKTALEQLG